MLRKNRKSNNITNRYKIENITNQNKHLINQIVSVCSRLDETVAYHLKFPKDKTDEIEDIETEEKANGSLQLSIGKHKDKISALMSKMEAFYNLRKIESNENQIKDLTNVLQSVLLENQTLRSIQNKQITAQEEHSNKNENSEESKALQNRIKLMKEDMKYNKHILKGLEAKERHLRSEISFLQGKCTNIQENIEYKKKTQDETVCLKSEIAELEERGKFLDIQVPNEEKIYRNEINKQNNLIDKIKKQNTMLMIQLAEKEQLIRIAEENNINVQVNSKEIEDEITILATAPNVKLIKKVSLKPLEPFTKYKPTRAASSYLKKVIPQKKIETKARTPTQSSNKGKNLRLNMISSNPTNSKTSNKSINKSFNLPKLKDNNDISRIGIHNH